MWTSRTPAIAMALVCAATLTACRGGTDGQADERLATTQARPDRPAAGSPDGPAAALVSLSGCLEAAPGTRQYVLRNVRFEPRSAGDPHATTTTPGGHGITEGAWVRVDAGDRRLDDHLGQRVVLKGSIADDGRNTIGTAGAPGARTPAGDTSQAASPGHHSDKQKKEMGRIARESMADGTAARIAVEDVTSTGDRCAAAQPAR